MNRVGTFGVASASYYLSRVATAIGRLTPVLSGTDVATWHQCVAGTYHLEADGSGYRGALVGCFVLRATAGVQLSLAKDIGRDTVS